MLPKRRHGNVSESSSGDIKRIRIVSKENQNEETTFMCEICSKILKSSETLKSHMKAMRMKNLSAQILENPWTQ